MTSQSGMTRSCEDRRRAGRGRPAGTETVAGRLRTAELRLPLYALHGFTERARIFIPWADRPMPANPDTRPMSGIGHTTEKKAGTVLSSGGGPSAEGGVMKRKFR